jgi:DNA-binding NtrC family response regulator
MTDTPRVLIVDDQPDFARGLARLLTPKLPGTAFDHALSGDEALAALERDAYAVLVTDLRMPGLSGLDLLPRALARTPHLGVVLLTAYGDIDTAVAALKAGAYDFLTKPVDSDQLARVIAKGLERHALLRENTRLRAMAAACCADAGLLGQSPAMAQIKKTIAAVAASDYTVLVRGESGTGKELASRAIHSLSRRASGRFFRSTARPSRTSSSKASCSATCAGPSPAPNATAEAFSCPPTAACSCSTKSATSP